MNIAIIGYGRMGKAIEKIAVQRGHTIGLIIDNNNNNELNNKTLKDIDVCIEFSLPHTAYDNYIKCFNEGKPVVSGTTGWLDKFNDIKKMCDKRANTFFYASNFSIGVNIFFKVNQYLAKIMDNFNEYAPEMTEIHHIHKLDSPSGTGITLANDIINNIDRLNEWKEDDKTNCDKNILPINAKREGMVPGTHSVKYDSVIDYLEITHSAKSREGFAMGAVLAAEFAAKNSGFLTMDDMLNI
ncbi:MAG: 4-hydroxy-tetrahydrodipicolinate reductase [Bacteroidales bacterium]|jgi:4-hydroxy-tetrahydrodipicolinate reductase|nr:4-hydroxy-tetrahydrodipicolinate reductase [Bacteroidales bacterium]